MGYNPINLAFRFLLEITALFAVGYWGYTQHEGFIRYLLALLLPILFATVWTVFNVPNDKSRSGKAPVVVPGFMRLFIELSIFTLAAFAIHASGHAQYAIIFSVIAGFHYLIAYDRIRWLLSKQNN